jgi:molybdate transport system substrate-binding protein
MTRTNVFILTLLAGLAGGASLWTAHPAQAESSAALTIAAANSLRPALKELLPLFEQQHKAITVRVVYGPSQSLRKQIEEGAPVDIFLPSSLDEITALENKGLIVGNPRIYGSSSLVLITNTAVPTPVGSLQDFRKPIVRRIAIGDPKTSSVGKFAAQCLRSTGLDQDLRSRYVYGEHSGAVLDLVAKGEADVGLVYRTDAIGNRKVRIIGETPPNSHQPVIYGLAAPWTVGELSKAREFETFMASAPVQAILHDYGFDEAKTDVPAVQK